MAAATSSATLYTTNTATATPATVATAVAERPKLTLRTTSTFTVNGSLQQLSYYFEVSPNEVNLQRLALQYNELDRPGIKPMLQSRNPQLQQMTVTAIVSAHGDDKYFETCQPQIDGLLALVGMDVDLVIAYPGVPATMTWRITDLSLRTMRRNDMNEITIAEANITFTEATQLPAVVPGMPVIKDVVMSRKVNGKPTNAVTPCQMYAGTDTSLRDPDTGCRIDVVVLAGMAP